MKGHKVNFWKVGLPVYVCVCKLGLYTHTHTHKPMVKVSVTPKQSGQVWGSDILRMICLRWDQPFLLTWDFGCFYSIFHSFNFHLYIFLMLHLFELTNRKSISFIHKKHSKSFSINLVILMNFKSIIEALKLRYNSLLKFVSFDLSPLSSSIN